MCCFRENNGRLYSKLLRNHTGEARLPECTSWIFTKLNTRLCSRRARILGSHNGRCRKYYYARGKVPTYNTNYYLLSTTLLVLELQVHKCSIVQIKYIILFNQKGRLYYTVTDNIVSDYTLAIATNARLFSRVKFVSIVVGRHASGRDQLFGIHVGRSSPIQVLRWIRTNLYRKS